MKNSKWFISFLIIGLGIASCLDDEPTLNAVYNYKAIDSVRIGEIHPARQVTEIKTFYTQTNSCEYFFDYEYQILGNERNVMMVTAKNEEPGCEPQSRVDSSFLQFKPESGGTYRFRFWSGTDENGQDTFIIREIEIP